MYSYMTLQEVEKGNVPMCLEYMCHEYIYFATALNEDASHVCFSQTFSVSKIPYYHSVYYI